MKKEDLSKHKQIPNKPGVYFFMGKAKKVLYIGKAGNLKTRVRSYFDHDLKDRRSAMIEKMVKEAIKIEYTITDSVLEALLLESNLIRTHKPYYNTRSKDGKSYLHLIITNEEYPRVLLVRAKDVTERFDKNEILHNFGPYPEGRQFRIALKLVRRLFQFYDTKNPIHKERSSIARGRMDFNRQLGLYPDKQDKQSYLRTIKHLALFFNGNKKQVISNLQKEMTKAVKVEDFETAKVIRDKIFALNHIQDIALITDDSKIYRDEKRLRIEAYDIAHLQGSHMVGAMTVVENSEPVTSEYRRFKIKTVEKSNDTASLSELINRRLQHKEWPLPQIVVVDGALAQKRVAEKVLRENNVVIPVVAVVKNRFHKPERLLGLKDLTERYQQEIYLTNAEAHRFAIAYHRKKRTIKI